MDQTNYEDPKMASGPLTQKVDAVTTALAELIAYAVKSALEAQGARAPAAAAEPEAAAEPAAAKGRKGRAAKAKPPAPTVDEVRAALVALAEAQGKQAVVDILAAHEVTKIGDLAEENYQAVLDAAEAAATAEEEPEAAEDEDLFS